MMRSGVAAVLLLCGGLAACGPGDSSGPADAGTQTTPDAGSAADAGSADGGSECTSAYQYALGFPCNRAADCITGKCLDDVDRQLRYCSARCTPGAASACPRGYVCEDPGDGSGAVCRIEAGGASLPGNRSLPAGSPCNSDEDCSGESTRCFFVDGGAESVCAPPCGDNADCGACGRCLYTGGSNDVCVPRGAGRIGEACRLRHDCASFECAGFCTQECGTATDPDCPEGSRCMKVGNDKSVCATDANIGNMAPGERCTWSFQCHGERPCLFDSVRGEYVCFIARRQGEACNTAEECEPGLRCLDAADGSGRVCQGPGVLGASCENDQDCGGGLQCRRFGSGDSRCAKPCGDGCGEGASCVAPDLDTGLRLLDESGLELAANDDADAEAGVRWSELVFVPVASGTYHVAVRGYGSSAGAYLLEISDGSSGSPAQITESEPNNDTNTSTPLPGAPVAVSATLASASDVDVFALVVSSTSPLRVRTRRGAPSLCLPSTQVGQVALGDACTLNLECDSGDCNGRLGVCVMACGTGLPDCAENFSCVGVGAARSCVKTELVGVKGRGASCDFEWECLAEVGYCATVGDQRFCTARCESAACLLREECASLDVARGGQLVVEKACIPKGRQETPFNEACFVDSDCAPCTAPGCGAALCVDRRCTRACSADAGCPAQNFPPPAGCEPCSTWQDCPMDADCVPLAGAEKVCARVCGDQGACPEGFVCGYDGLCLPAHGSCHRPVCTTGRCVVPASAFAELCAADSACTTGRCGGASGGLGLCSKSCSGTGGAGECCANGDLACVSGQCAPSPSLAREQEPNDDVQHAQALSLASPVTMLAALQPPPLRRDADWFKVTLAAGDNLVVETRAVCGDAAPGLDLAVMLVRAGRPVAQDGAAQSYGTLSYRAAAAGDYFILVADPGAAAQAGAYVLSVRR